MKNDHPLHETAEGEREMRFWVVSKWGCNRNNCYRRDFLVQIGLVDRLRGG